MKLLGAEITPRRVVARVGGHPISYGAPEDGLAHFRREFPEVFEVGAGDIRFVRCEHLPHSELDHPRWDITFTGVTEGWPGVLVPSGNSRGRDGVWEVTGVQPPPPPLQRVKRLGRSAQVQAPPPPPLQGYKGRERGGGDAEGAVPMEGVNAAAHTQRPNVL